MHTFTMPGRARRLLRATAAATVGGLMLVAASTTGAAARPVPQSPPGPSAPVRGTVQGRVLGARAVTARNRAAVERFRQLRSSTRTPRLADSTHHEWWGTKVSASSHALTSVIATQSVDTSLRLTNSDDVLYAPTLKPRDGACIEMVTVHTNDQPQIWAWDWCTSTGQDVGASVDVDSSFLKDYGTTVNGRSAYTVEVALTDAASNTWTAYLYDYATKAWQTFFTSGGTDQAGVDYGWDMFEFYSAVDRSTGNVQVCDDLSGRTVESSSLQVQTSAGWSPADPGNSSAFPSDSMDPSTYLCSGVTSSMVTPNSDWQVSVS
ncbi:hypothetical protein ABZ832_20265 [Streptantibioticus parmotrematis]|uniref:hypothetical protein n=1 Tax=Streptantibioticus parmotrematis TaxID=2873249 RepID=UPI0033E08FB5